MVNSIPHLEQMKDLMRGKPVKWSCRAGHNGILIRPDGTLSPCFDLITFDHDWGTIWHPKFDKDELAEVKRKCNQHCLSTCFYTMAHYYQPAETLKWMMKHTRIGAVR
jgi:radical SAM protein with 4Fe4S-binding SPASM domain